MKKLLITGFEPFGGESINPSWQAVELLPNEINGYSLTKMCIPVVFGTAAERVMRAIDELSPDVILCIGQAGGRAAVTPELVGINLAHATSPDNIGNQPIDQRICIDGADAYFSTLPVRRISDAISALGIPSYVSYSAGSYVCNNVFYTLLYRFKNTETRVGFIHIPYATEQGKSPSLELADLVRAIVAAIESID